MAGDWIKIEHALPDKPEVMEIANSLRIDADAVVGKLIRVWTWFDIHTENGNANVTMTALLDRYTGVTGFVTEMQKVGWIIENSGVLTINKFERHNGQTAKNRANTNRRVAKLRKCNDSSVTNVTTQALQKPLPEKRREEKIIVLSKDNTQSEKIYNLYPKKVGKDAALKAIKKALVAVDANTLEQIVTEYAESQKGQDAQFIPNPSTWFNQGRWQDDRSTWKRENKQMSFGTKSLSRDDRHPKELKEETDLSTLPVWDAMKDK